ncbi:hypothetical protein BDN72DRAFT_820585 [Pluteus cervinus]|uniref:Uncharacterized protein n=1 Tax=Pluteus cervinus TaxID=181527 RepID=A0ACD3AUF1_9AGAR|nr:hypothetical protein BDN72DRAFT_820585 [Pluteus cervinus]
MLPEGLFLLLNALLAAGQSRQPLPLNSVISLGPQDGGSNLPLFEVPPAATLTITIAICAPGSSARFFITNNTAGGAPSSSGGPNVAEIPIIQGNGIWSGLFGDGGLLAAENIGQTTFEIATSDQEPLHEVLDAFPLLGDSTSSQAILFSHPILPGPTDLVSTYPNYTLPAANLSAPQAPTLPGNLSLVLLQTTLTPPGSFPQTACMLSSQQPLGNTTDNSLWLKGLEGWRNEWLSVGLEANTNYTAYVIQNATKLSGPLFFVTKSPDFPCQLVHSLPYCPSTAYSVPLPPPPDGALLYDALTLPENITTSVISTLANFTISLTTFACGRDWYSPLMGCSDCQREYRKWLCAVSFPRCGESSAEDPNGVTNTSTSSGQQTIPSALVPQTPFAVPRSPSFPAIPGSYNLLLPCLEVCTAVDRACPNFIQFRCPTRKFNAGASYGVGYVDGADGEEGGGATGVTQDQWGNIWCNGA